MFVNVSIRKNTQTLETEKFKNILSVESRAGSVQRTELESEVADTSGSKSFVRSEVEVVEPCKVEVQLKDRCISASDLMIKK